MTVRLYVVPASHPCAAVELALRTKGVAYEVTELPTGLHAAHQRLRFGSRTVPALRADGSKVTGSREIMRWLESRQPEPALWPPDPERRAAVEEAEAWGDEVLQGVVRRLAYWALRKRPDAMPSYLAKSRLRLPAPVVRLAGPLSTAIGARLNGVGEEAARADLARFPRCLERIDRWIEGGVIGGERPNAADLQIASSLALARTLGDLAPLVDGSRAGELPRRWFGDYPGWVPPGALA
jgi:glutathione S-transferase